METIPNFWIFGDSYSAPWTYGRPPFASLADYIKEEYNDGNTAVQDLEYWLRHHSNINFQFCNFAEGGMSNDTILDNAYKYFHDICKNDYVLLQLSLNTRIQSIHNNLNEWWDVQISNLNSSEYIKEINQVSLLNYKTLEKIALQRSTTIHLFKILDQANMFISAVKNLGAKACFTSLDRNLEKYTDIPGIYWDLEIFKPIEDKYPHIPDRHPTYEGNSNIAKKILEVLDRN